MQDAAITQSICRTDQIIDALNSCYFWGQASIASHTLNMLYDAMTPIERNDGTRPKPHTDCECSSDTWERREVSVSPPSSSTWGITRSGVSWLEFFESLTKFSVRSIPARNAVWASDRATTRFTRMRGRCFRQSLEPEKRERLYQVENLIIMIIITTTLLYTYAHFH